MTIEYVRRCDYVTIFSPTYNSTTGDLKMILWALLSPIDVVRNSCTTGLGQRVMVFRRKNIEQNFLIAQLLKGVTNWNCLQT